MERNDTARRQNRLTDQIAAEAADWFARLQDPTTPAMERDEFTKWLLRSPTHIEEYLAITRLWGDVETLGDFSTDELIRQARAEEVSDNVVALHEPETVRRATPSETATQSSSSRRRWAIAAALVLAVVGGWVVLEQLDPSRLVTAVGEQRSVTLRDGSVVFLNTDSDVSIELSDRERRVTLARGEARFTVAKDAARPFLVSTRQATVRAVGTVFNVRTTDSRTAVTVIEGRVALSSRAESGSSAGDERPLAGTDRKAASRARSAQSAQLAGHKKSIAVPIREMELAAGQHAAITEEGTFLPNVGPSVERALAWSDRRLVFRDEALADVVAEFNRYRERPIRIADPALAALRISGSFYAGDPQSLIQYLERYEQVRISEDVDHTSIHSGTTH